LLQLVEYNSCHAKATTLRNGQRHGNGDGQWQWQLRWPTVIETAMANGKGNSNAMAYGNATEMATAMVDGDHNSNGQWQRQWQWAIVTATATATAMAMATVTEMAMVMAMATAMARVTITKEGLPLHVAATCLLEGQHLASTPMDTKESACIMGVTLQRVFAPLQGGGFLRAHHGLFVDYFLQLLFSLLNNPLFAFLHYSSAQEPCQLIDVLSPPLLQEHRQPIDNLPQLLLHFLSR
jgi:hypothetical protein